MCLRVKYVCKNMCLKDLHVQIYTAVNVHVMYASEAFRIN